MINTRIQYTFFAILILITWVIPVFKSNAAFTISRPVGNNLGLVGHWTFDGKDMPQGRVNDVMGSNSASKVNMATSTTNVLGQIGQAVNFDGVDDYIIKVSPSGLPTGASSRTMSMWVKIENISAGQIFGGYGDDANAQNFQIGTDLTDGSMLQFFGWGTGNDYETTISMAPYNDGQYHHFLVTYDGVTLRFYVDGVLGDSSNETLNTAGTTLCIGGEVNNATCDRWFNGSVDDFRIYSRVLSTTEVSALYNQGAATKLNTTPKGNTSQLVGHWTFDGKDMPQGLVKDISNSGNNGSMGSMATSTAYVIGKIGQALNFDGTDDYIVMNSPSYIPVALADDYSIATWIYVNDATAEQGVAGWTGTANSSEPFAFLIVQAEEFRFLDRNDSATVRSLLTTTAIEDQWVHLAGTKNGNEFKFYVNGVLVDSTSAAGATSNSERSIFLIGSTNSTAILGNSPLNGKIDDVRAYSRGLSADEVRGLYNAGR